MVFVVKNNVFRTILRQRFHLHEYKTHIFSESNGNRKLYEHIYETRICPIYNPTVRYNLSLNPIYSDIFLFLQIEVFEWKPYWFSG